MKPLFAFNDQGANLDTSTFGGKLVMILLYIALLYAMILILALPFIIAWCFID